MDDSVELNIGGLIRFYSTNAMFWHDKDEYEPLLGSEVCASDIYTEKENPLAMILGADFSGAFIRVLWGERRGWVSVSSVSTL